MSIWTLRANPLRDLLRSRQVRLAERSRDGHRDSRPHRWWHVCACRRPVTWDTHGGHAQQGAARAALLLVAHLAAIIQGGLLLALTVAMNFSRQSDRLENTSAYILVGGVVLFIVGNSMNWLHGTEDAFADKTVGNKVAAAGTPLIIAGAGISCMGSPPQHE